jgi:hypothetical protein
MAANSSIDHNSKPILSIHLRSNEFNGRVEEIDLLQLPNYRIYIKLMIDGTPSMPFSAVTLSHAILSAGYRTAKPSDSPRLDGTDRYT